MTLDSTNILISDYDAFEIRIKSFHKNLFITRQTNNERISCIDLASHGWINTGVNVLNCSGCGARLLYSVPKDALNKSINKINDAFFRKVKKHHNDNCVWLNVNNNDFLYFYLDFKFSESNLLTDYEKRVSSYKFLNKYGLDNFNFVVSEASQHGWKFIKTVKDKTNNSKICLCCDYCLRSVVVPVSAFFSLSLEDMRIKKNPKFYRPSKFIGYPLFPNSGKNLVTLIKKTKDFKFSLCGSHISDCPLVNSKYFKNGESGLTKIQNFFGSN